MPRLESPPGRAALARLLRAIMRSRFFWILMVAAAAVSTLYFSLRPHVQFVPMLERGKPLIIRGHGFGRGQNDGYVLYKRDGRPTDLFADVRSWNDSEIVVSIPMSALRGGHVQVVKRTPLWEWPSNPVPYVVQARGLPSEPYGYENLVRADSPWPTFRRDRRNTGRSTLPAVYSGDYPWSFATGKGIFSTPVIDGDGIVYVGSADHYFYAVNPDGSLRWRYKTGELIDSAAALHRTEPGSPPTVTFGSGDGFLYHLRTDNIANAADRLLWKFDAASAPGQGYNNWWEGSVQIGFDGVIYAGNTNWNYYALNPDGTLRWTLATGNNNWSVAALADDGSLYWGSCDTNVHATGADGRPKWHKRTLGFVASSAAVARDGTLYIGSFDTHLYAFAPDSPWPKWKFQTGDHIYCSPALGQDADGNTNAIYFGSTDGTFYALQPDGKLNWSYYAGDPIRSSPALGAGPNGEPDAIVYFGCSNGKLYALNTANGSRRWSFDTTPKEPELKDRNDLNGSPALGKTGVYVGGEHGYLWYVPYDYGLDGGRAPMFAALADRIDTNPGGEWPDTTASLLYVTPGGNTMQGFPEELPAATIITLRLMVREHGRSIDARFAPRALRINLLQKSDSGYEIEPGVYQADMAHGVAPAPGAGVPLRCERSAGGDYLHIIPEDFLAPGATYGLFIQCEYLRDGIRLGNLAFGGRMGGEVKEQFTFRVTPPDLPALPLSVDKDKTSALEFTRLAVPVPTMMPSLNQIGFDYAEMILGAAHVSAPDANGRGSCLIWTIGGQLTEQGELAPNVMEGVNTETDLMFPFNGRYLGNDFILEARNITLGVTGIDIPFQRLDLRGRLGADGRVLPGATAYAETQALSVPTYGPLLILAGLANNFWEKLLVVGTYITRPYEGRGTANLRPEGVSVKQLEYVPAAAGTPASVSAVLEVAPDAHYLLNEHRAAILLVDADTGLAVTLDYGPNTRCMADSTGQLSRVSLDIPRDTSLPDHLRAVVLLDVYPVFEQQIP